jgi:hypothetical protein
MIEPDKITDKEIEILFKSIDNPDEFKQRITEGQGLKLKNDIEIRFNNGIEGPVTLCLPSRTLTLEGSSFRKIFNELIKEKATELSLKSKVSEDRLRNEIFEFGGNRFKVHKEYIESMYFESDVASLHGSYVRKLIELVSIFHRKNLLIIDTEEISSRDELIEFLKARGFTGVENALKLGK